MRNFFQIFLKLYSKFISSFLRISFGIFLKSFKYFLKIFATFIPENFSEICTNFSKTFLKNLVQISKILLWEFSNFMYTLSKISRKFSLFCRISTNFHYNFITSQHFHNQLISCFLWLFFNFFIKFYKVFLKFKKKNHLDDFYLV